MKYCLFKLGFTSPVHFGSGAMAHSLDTGEMTCHADTLFSALCHTASVLGGESKVEWLSVRHRPLVHSIFPALAGSP